MRTFWTEGQVILIIHLWLRKCFSKRNNKVSMLSMKASKLNGSFLWEVERFLGDIQTIYSLSIITRIDVEKIMIKFFSIDARDTMQKLLNQFSISICLVRDHGQKLASLCVTRETETYGSRENFCLWIKSLNKIIIIFIIISIGRQLEASLSLIIKIIEKKLQEALT